MQPVNHICLRLHNGASTPCLTASAKHLPLARGPAAPVPQYYKGKTPRTRHQSCCAPAPSATAAHMQAVVSCFCTAIQSHALWQGMGSACCAAHANNNNIEQSSRMLTQSKPHLMQCIWRQPDQGSAAGKHQRVVWVEQRPPSQRCSVMEVSRGRPPWCLLLRRLSCPRRCACHVVQRRLMCLRRDAAAASRSWLQVFAISRQCRQAQEQPVRTFQLGGRRKAGEQTVLQVLKVRLQPWLVQLCSLHKSAEHGSYRAGNFHQNAAGSVQTS